MSTTACPKPFGTHGGPGDWRGQLRPAITFRPRRGKTLDSRFVPLSWSGTMKMFVVALLLVAFGLFAADDKAGADTTARPNTGAPAVNTSRPRASEPRLKIERSAQRLRVRARVPGTERWADLATFVMDPQLRPYLHPLRDASGRVVLTEDRPDDHPWQHGIFTGFHRVNGFNYWKEDQGKQRFMKLLDSHEKADRVSWCALVEYIAPDGTVVLEEEDAITFHAPVSADTYVIDFDLLLRAKD